MYPGIYKGFIRDAVKVACNHVAAGHYSVTETLIHKRIYRHPPRYQQGGYLIAVNVQYDGFHVVTIGVSADLRTSIFAD